MDDDTEGRNGPRRQKLLHLTRDDLAQIPDKQARELLAQYEPLIRSFVRRFPRGLLAGAQFDADDLYALGQVMLLQAWLSYRPEAAEGGSFRGWATFLLRQRWGQLAGNLAADREVAATDLFLLVERGAALTNADCRPFGGAIGGHALDWADNALTHTPALDDAVEQAQQVRLFEMALEDLTPRLRFVLEGVRAGRTTAEIAVDLGVNRQRVDQLREEAIREVRRTIARWRAEADEEELEDEDEDPAPATLRAWPATRSASSSSPS